MKQPVIRELIASDLAEAARERAKQLRADKTSFEEMMPQGALDRALGPARWRLSVTANLEARAKALDKLADDLEEAAGV